MEKPKWYAMVTAIAVLGLLAAGISTVSAAEGGILPELKGFQGMMSGQVVKKGTDSFTFKVGKITRKWRHNKAEKPEAAIGKVITISLKKIPKHHHERVMKDYANLKNGDALVLDAEDLGQSTLCVLEELKKGKAAEE